MASKLKYMNKKKVCDRKRTCSKTFINEFANFTKEKDLSIWLVSAYAAHFSMTVPFWAFLKNIFFPSPHPPPPTSFTSTMLRPQNFSGYPNPSSLCPRLLCGTITSHFLYLSVNGPHTGQFIVAKSLHPNFTVPITSNYIFFLISHRSNLVRLIIKSCLFACICQFTIVECCIINICTAKSISQDFTKQLNETAIKFVDVSTFQCTFLC